jgi:Uma2 family endonuclease
MTNARRLHYTYQEYLRALEDSELKLEYCDGVIYAMAGGTPTHAELSARAIQLLGRSLPAGCRVYTSDLKVRIEATDLSTFPDVSVVCGDSHRSPLDAQALTNPALLVEVTSPSTEDSDRGDKLQHYQQLPSLRAVLFLSHRAPRVTLIERRAGAWVTQELGPGDRVAIDQPGVSFAVDDLYAGVLLEPAGGP